MEASMPKGVTEQRVRGLREAHKRRVKELMEAGVPEPEAVQRAIDEMHAAAKAHAQEQAVANAKIGVRRKGNIVQVYAQGAPRGIGIKHRNAQSARETEEGLRRRLVEGWPGTFEELLQTVTEETRQKEQAFDRRRALKAEVEAAERKLEEARSALKATSR